MDLGEMHASSDPISQLQQRIKTLIQERDEAQDQVNRLQKRLPGSKDVWQQRVKEAESSSKAKQAQLTQQHAGPEGDTKAREMVKRLTERLVNARAEQRELNAKKACALERLQEAKQLNTTLERSNSALALQLASTSDTVSTYTQALRHTQELERQQRTLIQLLKTQEELVQAQSQQLLDQSTQVRDVRTLYQYSLGGSPRSGFRSLQSGQQTPTAAVNAKKLRREIKRYQRERNELEIELGAASQKAAKALKQLIQSKSKALRLLSAG